MTSAYRSMRCDCRYGSWGPPTPTPSSQSMPSQCRPSSTWLNDSSESRAASVSSIRNTSLPPVWCAYAQLNRAVRTIPTCGVPVGEGQKRTRVWLASASAGPRYSVIIVLLYMCQRFRWRGGVLFGTRLSGAGWGGLAADSGDERADAFNFHLDLVAFVQHGGSCGGSGEDNVAR